jgi:enoyl-CoA hydratase/carnithine racemase
VSGVLNIEDRDAVLLIELDHGKVNALDLELLGALIETLRTAGPDQRPVLTAATLEPAQALTVGLVDEVVQELWASAAVRDTGAEYLSRLGGR